MDWGVGRSDAMSPGCQIDGNARHKSLDDEIEFEAGESGSVHDIISLFGAEDHEADPAEDAARNIDWQSFLDSHPPRYRTAICVLVDGGTMREAGKRCGLKDSAALTLKRRIAADLIEFFGAEVIGELLGGIRPAWDSDLRLARERSYSHEGVFQSLAQPWTSTTPNGVPTGNPSTASPSGTKAGGIKLRCAEGRGGRRQILRQALVSHRPSGCAGRSPRLPPPDRQPLLAKRRVPVTTTYVNLPPGPRTSDEF